jgi:hypothetical protein
MTRRRTLTRSESLVAAARGPRRRTAFFCPEVRPLAAAEHTETRGSKAPMRGASPAGFAPSQKNAVPSQNPPRSLTKLRQGPDLTRPRTLTHTGSLLAAAEHTETRVVRRAARDS